MARQFDNSASNNVLSNGSPVITGPPFTVFLLVKADATPTNNGRPWGLFSSASNTHYFTVTLVGTGSSGVDITARGTGGDNKATTTNNWSAGGVHRIVAVARGTADREIWLDGDDANSGTNTTSTTVNTPNRHAIGSIYRQSPTAAYDGQIQTVVLWNVALPDALCIAMGQGKMSPHRVRRDAMVELYELNNAGNASGDVPNLVGTGETLTEVGTVGYATAIPAAPSFGFDQEWMGAFTSGGAGPVDQEPSLIGGKLINRGVLQRHLVG